MVGWTNCSSQKGHEPPMCTNLEHCCLYTALKGVVFDGVVKTSRPLCTPPSVTCVHLCVFEGFGLEYINMEGEDDFEMEYSTEELVQLMQDGEHVLDSMEEVTH
jgi:hypothetical protein